MAANVSRFTSLQLAPDTLCGIQIRRIRRELNQLHSLSATLFQELPDHHAPVRRQAIPNDHQLAGDMAQ